MTYDTLQVETTPAGIALVWLNRPDLRNAFNETMIAELTAAFRALDADGGVRAIILAGHGKSFCAGADLNWMKKMSGYSFEQNYDDALGLANMLHTIHTVKKPTLARVHGAAFAGGMATAALGVAFHYAIATIMVLAYTLLGGRHRELLRHPVRYGLPYGLLLWLVMTCVVVPLSQAQPSAKPLLLAVVTNFLMHLLLGVLCAGFARRAHALRS